MAEKANIIILNGRRYDAVTGRLLDQAGATKASANNVGSAKLAYNRAAVQSNKSKPTAKPAMQPITKPTMDVVRPAAAPLKRHPAKKGQTLARHSVTKPTVPLKRHLKAQQRTDMLVKAPTIEVKPKISGYRVDPKRVAHAKATPQHEHVSRYAKKAALPESKAAQQPAIPAKTAAPVAATPSQPVAAPPESNRSVDIFEQALARATSHQQQPLSRRQAKRRKQALPKRALSMASASLAVLLVAGFFAWQQKANLTMHYAASKAGVAASLPDYQPAGYQVGSFTYNPGLVAVNYNNPTSGGQFALIERSTNWDSQSLRDNFVATSSEHYQTIDTAGRTIYTYGDNNATWVDNGIWYQINSQGALSTNQLVDLAVSL